MGGNVWKEVHEKAPTKRWELLGVMELPIAENVLFTADQISFTETSLTKQRWFKLTGIKLKNHDMLEQRRCYNYYNDNTPATVQEDIS
jgi:hypothetical protein